GRVCRSSALSQARGGGEVEPSVRIDDHAIVAPRVLRRDEAVEDVVKHALRVARAGVADAAAPRQLEQDRIAWWHRLPSFGADGAAGTQRHRARRTGMAAVTPARRVVHAFEVAQQRDRRGTGPAGLDHLAEAAAQFAGTAGAVPGFTAIESHGSGALGRFHG